jgi:hypothetical protein
VQGVGHQLLAGAALAADEDAGVGRRGAAIFSRSAAIAGESPRISPPPSSERSSATSRRSAVCSRVLRIERSRRSLLKGFSMKSWTPSFRASTVSEIDASPEMMTVGGSDSAAASRRTRSRPERPGRRTSSSSRSGRPPPLPSAERAASALSSAVGA